jgi:DNA-binding response OmpR family regulator
MGADDYITKPFSLREVEARTACAAARAPESPPAAAMKRRSFAEMASRSRTSRSDDRRSARDLTPKEFDLLPVRIKPGPVFPRKYLLERFGIIRTKGTIAPSIPH